MDKKSVFKTIGLFFVILGLSTAIAIGGIWLVDPDYLKDGGYRRDVPLDELLKDKHQYVNETMLTNVGDISDEVESGESSIKLSVDTSTANDGYITVSCESGGYVRLLLQKDGQFEYMPIKQDGSEVVYPMSLGNGTYTVSVNQWLSPETEQTLFSEQIEVAMENEMLPFLQPNTFVNYDDSMTCIQKADKMKRETGDGWITFVRIFKLAAKNIRYDKERYDEDGCTSAFRLNPEIVYTQETGVCVDKACLLASMMRRVGIPAKMVIGTGPGGGRHAWNEVYVLGRWRLVDSTPTWPNMLFPTKNQVQGYLPEKYM